MNPMLPFLMSLAALGAHEPYILPYPNHDGLDLPFEGTYMYLSPAERPTPRHIQLATFSKAAAKRARKAALLAARS